MRMRSCWNIWTLSATLLFIAYLVFLVYPVAMVLGSALFVDGRLSLGNFAAFFSKAYYFNTLVNSFAVSGVATVLALVLGSVLGYLFAMFRFKGKRLLQILIVIASMSPPFVGAYSWILLLGRQGIITKFLHQALGFPQINIYGFAGIVLVFTLQLFPLVFLYVSGALKNVDSSLLEASESLGCRGPRRFVHVLLPLMTPTIVAAALLVFMRAFADFGTPMLIGEGFRTFPVTIYQEFISEVGGTNSQLASALAIIAIMIALVVFLMQQVVANRFSFSMSCLRPLEAAALRSWKRIVTYAIVYGIVLLSVLPQAYLVFTSFQNTRHMVTVPGYSLGNYETALSRDGASIINTIRLPLMGLALVLIAGTVLSYLAIRRRSPLTRLLDTMSMVPYIIPGTVLGIAFISAFNAGVAGSRALVLTGTVGIMVISFALRRLPYTVRSSEAALRQIPSTIEEAAQSLGSSRLNTFVRITLPMMASGIVSGAILTWITMISELSTSILLYTVKTRTMTVAIYTEVVRGNYGIAAALATILIAFTVASLLLFMRISKNESITLS